MEIREILRCIDAEPETPGEMPEEMWQRFKGVIENNDKEALSEMVRIIIRCTKYGIRDRIIDVITDRDED